MATMNRPSPRRELTPFTYHTAFMKQMPHIPRSLPRHLDDVTPHEFRIEPDASGTIDPVHRIWRGDFLIGYTGTHHVEQTSFGSSRHVAEQCLHLLRGFTPNTHVIGVPNSHDQPDLLERVCTYYNASVRYYNEHYGPYVDWSNERHLETHFQSSAARRALDSGYFDLECELRTHLKRLVIGAGLELIYRPFDAVDVHKLRVTGNDVRYDHELVARIQRHTGDTIVTFDRDHAVHRYLDANASDADILAFLCDDLTDALVTMRRTNADRYLEKHDPLTPADIDRVVPLLACADAHNHQYGKPYFKP